MHEITVFSALLLMPTQDRVRSPLLFRGRLVLCVAGRTSHGKGGHRYLVLTL